MTNIVLIYKYSCKEFMNLQKIIEFEKNLESLQKKDKQIKTVFFGDTSSEELSVFMSYFNLLLKRKLCDIAFNISTNEMIIGDGINNKSIKKSVRTSKKINNNILNIIKDYYNPTPIDKIIEMPTKNWENTILDV